MVLNSKRTKFEKGKMFSLFFPDANNNFAQRDITIIRSAGDGASCLCYDVEVQWNKTTKKRMILKMFYPKPTDLEVGVFVEGIELRISDIEAVMTIKNRFNHALALQNELANNNPETAAVVVSPIENSDPEGLSQYVLYEQDWSNSLEMQNTAWEREKSDILPKEFIHKKLVAVCETAKALHLLHRNKILHMDLKPSNILYIASQKKVKFFDFDSSIRLDDLDSVSTIYGDNILRLAPELRKLDTGDQSDFDIYKRLYLTPQVDIYSLGCILYEYIFGRLPEKKDIKNPLSIVKKMDYLFQTELYGIFTEKMQNLLKYIVFTSVSESLKHRYKTAQQMADDLKEVIDYLEHFEEIPLEEAVNFEMIAAQTLDKNPVCDYPAQDRSDIVIVGNAPIREGFFRNIFACVQMPNRLLSIYFVSPDAAEYAERLFTLYPMLRRTTIVSIDGEISENLDLSVTTTPLAFLAFISTDDMKETLVKIISDRHPRYFLLANRHVSVQDSSNREIAIWIAEQFAETTIPTFIGWGDVRGDGLNLRPLKDSELPENRFIVTDVFPLTTSFLAKDAEREKAFEEDIIERAFQIHKRYASKDQTPDQIRQDFESEKGNYYNKRSSVRAVLSWPYKLASCGIKNDELAAPIYREQILSENVVQELRETQLFLEHRSWICFMIVDGWRNPFDKEVEQYAYVNGNDHRDKINRLHPCMVDSAPEQKLQVLGRNESKWIEAWQNPDERNKYDLLDQMSLQFHALAKEKAEKSVVSEYFPILLKEFAYTGNSMEEEIHALSNAYQNLLRGIDGSGKECEKILSELEESFGELKSVSAILDIIRRNMKPALIWARYQDYKLLDEDILEALTRINGG